MEELKLSQRDIYFLINIGRRPLWLSGAHLTGADLSDAYLVDAYLVDAHLRGVNLNGANLNGAKYSISTSWPSGFDPIAAGAILVEVIYPPESG